MELLHDFIITLEHFDGIPSLLFFRHIVYDSFFNMCERMLDRSGETVLRNCLCVLGRIDRCFCRFHDTVTFQCGDINDFTAELSLKFRNIDLIPVFLNDIHHVDGHDDRDPKLGELGRQVEVSFEIRTIDDV